jgi:DNA-binding CsgD family transcriptional regulator
MIPSAANELVVDAGRRLPARQAEPETGLTPIEIRIVGMLAGGDSYGQVGYRLGITVNTVRNYIRSIYAKLRVHTKAEAVSKALRTRIIC